MKLNLPVHPTNRHPLTGLPVTAVGVRADGRPMWPFMGGAPDDGTQGQQGTQDAGGQQGAQQGAQDGGQQQGAQGGGQQGAQGEPPAPTQLPPTDPNYFPANTPVESMTIEQRAAYWQWNSKKHERRASEWYQKVGGGNQSAEQVAAALEAQRIQGLSDAERALEEARTQGRQEATGAMSQSMATLAFETAMAHVPEGERPELLSMIDRASVIKEDGSIDTDKVAKIVARIAPVNGTGPGHQRNIDLGGGRRSTETTGSGLAAGAARFREKHAKKTT